jgi:hypothetical protein
VVEADSQTGPHAEYAARHREACRDHDRLSGREGSLRVAQVVAVLAGVLPVVFAYAFVSPVWLILPAGAFVALVSWQRRVRRALARRRHRIAYYRRGLERLEGRWAGTGDPGTDLAPPDHPYAADLDLFGVGSLFERLSTARTRAGARALASWLLAPASPEEVRARQEAVDDLRDRLDLREELSLLGAHVPAGIDLDGLTRWGTLPPLLPSAARGVAAYGLMVLAAVLLVGWEGGPPALVVLRVLAVGQLLCWLVFARRVARVAGPLKRRSDELAVFHGLLGRIEREPFRSAVLTRLQESLRVAGEAPARSVARLARLAARLRLMENPGLRWLGWLEMRTTRVAFAAEAWRRAHGPAIGRWLDAVASFEALASLAAYAYENPSDPPAELAEGGPRLEAEGLGHPLLAPGACVVNGVDLGGARQGLIVTGSNMSGKSTLLRAVGVNVVLALAGAPVRARRLRLSPLAVAASLRVQDSLQAGQSRFLAEIRRLRCMADLARGPVPLLFLIDEILQGTNPADRRQGAEAVLLGFLGLGAVGLVTTHDLPLTALAERPDVPLENVHFADRLEDGRPCFDYRVRPGVVRQSNALALMRLIGLPTEVPAADGGTQ